jgi:hypothetical protein
VGLAETSHVNYPEDRPSSSLRRDGKLQTQPKRKGMVAKASRVLLAARKNFEVQAVYKSEVIHTSTDSI